MLDKLRDLVFRAEREGANRRVAFWINEYLDMQDQRNAARRWSEAWKHYTKEQSKIVFCVYCGNTGLKKDIAAHILDCIKHPLGKAIQRMYIYKRLFGIANAAKREAKRSNANMADALRKLRWRDIHDESCAINLDGPNERCDCGKDYTNTLIDETLGVK